jgi:Tol biopolymer transport system component
VQLRQRNAGHLLEPDGAVRALTSMLPGNFSTSFSRDGMRIVFASSRDGNDKLHQIYN